MEYIIVAFILIILIYLTIHHLNKGRSTSEVEGIRLNWGNPKSKSYFHFARISRYADALKEDFHRLTDQTIEDIDFHKLFKFIDRTTSKVGQQFLYKKVGQPTENGADQSEALIKLFNDDIVLREKVQLQLLKLSDDDAYHIVSLLGNTFLERPKWLKFIAVDLIIIVGLIILSFKYQI